MCALSLTRSLTVTTSDLIGSVCNEKRRAKSEQRLLVRREPQRLIVVLHPDVRLVADPVVDGDHYNHSAGGGKRRATVALRHRCALNVMAFDDAPFTTRAPILEEVVVRITRVLIGMLFPIRSEERRGGKE